MSSLAANIRRVWNRKIFGEPGKNYAKFLLLLLIDSPMAREEILKKYQTGVTLINTPESVEEMNDIFDVFDDSLECLIAEGYVELLDHRYCCTEKGNAVSKKMSGKIEEGVAKVSSGLGASVVSVAVNVFLAIICLIAGLLSNSMGMISSGIDNSIGVVSSVAAYYGLKTRKELYANILIVAMTLAIGLVVGYESIERLLRPVPVDAGMLPVLIALITAVLSFLLSRYQHFSGKISGKFSLIILSVDNINSVLVSIAVLIGILFAGFGIMIADSIVSLAVAVLMIKSSYDLGIQTYRMAKGREPDLSRFMIGPEKVLKERRVKRFTFWTLVILREPKTRAELEETFSLKNIARLRPIVKNLRIDLDYGKYCQDILDELKADGLIAESDGRYRTTEKGIRMLRLKLHVQVSTPAGNIFTDRAIR